MCLVHIVVYVLLVLFKVTELSPEETESVTGGYGKSISHVIIGFANNSAKFIIYG